MARDSEGEWNKLKSAETKARKRYFELQTSEMKQIAQEGAAPVALLDETAKAYTEWKESVAAYEAFLMEFRRP